MKYRFKIVHSMVKTVMFPCTFLGYAFYFLNWRIFVLMRDAAKNTEYWESRIVIWAGIIILFAFNFLCLPVSLSLLIKREWPLYLLFGTWMTIFGNYMAMDCGEVEDWSFDELIEVFFPPKPILPDPYENDPDYKKALKELEEGL